MPRASYGDRHCVSVLQAETLVTLDFTSRVIDFFTVHSTRPVDGAYPPPPPAQDPGPAHLWLRSPAPSRRVRRAPGPRCAARRGAGGAGPADTWLASCTRPVPGPPALIRHHLLGPRCQCPRQAVGPHRERWRAAEPPASLWGLGVCQWGGWGRGPPGVHCRLGSRRGCGRCRWDACRAFASCTWYLA